METNLTEDFFDRLGKDYEAAFSTNAPLNRFLEHAIATELPASASILDVGSGTGKPAASMLTAAGHRVHGIDRSRVMVDLARKQVPTATFERADMLAWEPPEAEAGDKSGDKGTFDGVFAIFVFFALERAQCAALLAKCHAWLKPRGRLYVGALAADDYDSDPAFPIEKARWDDDGLFVSGVEHKFMGDQVQISMFTREGWKRVLNEAGFEIVQTVKEGFVPANGHLYGRHEYYYISAVKRE